MPSPSPPHTPASDRSARNQCHGLQLSPVLTIVITHEKSLTTAANKVVTCGDPPQTIPLLKYASVIKTTHRAKRGNIAATAKLPLS